ncbi:MAG: metallophosphoesterase [Atribacterota bacterium]
MVRKFWLFLVVTVLVLVLAGSTLCWAFQEVKFAVISDPHLSYPAANTKDNVKMEDSSVVLFKEAIDQVNAIPDLDFVLLAGDLTKDAEPWNIDLLREMVEEIRVPAYAILGNHEVSPIPPKDKEPALATLTGSSKYNVVFALQGYGFEGAQSYWTAEPVPGVFLIGLDTSKVGSWGGKVSRAQLQWLEKQLFANQDKLTIVLGHHLLVPFREEEKKPEWKNFYLDNADEVIALFEKYPQVSFYLSGHRHVSTIPVEKNGIWYVENASTLTYPMSYTVYTLTPKTLSYEVVRLTATPEIWEISRKTMLEDAWWKPSSDATPEQVQAYYEANEFVKYSMPVRFQK